MGLFSSDKEYTAYISVAKLFNTYPTPIKDAVLLAVLSNSSISDSVLAAQKSTFNNNIAKYHKYGRDTWEYGLPTSNRRVWIASDDDVLEAVIDYSGDPDAAVISHRYGQIDPDFLASNYLTENYGDNSRSYILPEEVIIEGTTTITISTIRRYKSTSVEQITEFVEGFTFYNKYSFSFIDEVNTEVVIGEVSSKTTSFDNYTETLRVDNRGSRVHIEYVAGGTTHYWLYAPEYYYLGVPLGDLDTYPSLSPHVTESAGTSVFLQSIPLIRNRKQFTAYAEESPYRKSINTMGSILQLDPEDILKRFKEDNDLGDVEDVFLSFSLGINSEREASVAYMYEFFKFIVAGDFYYSTVRVGSTTAGYQEGGMEVLDGEYNYRLFWSMVVFTEDISGVIGEVGKCTKSIINNYVFTFTAGILGDHDISSSGPALVLRKQVSETHYEEIVVSGLVSRHIVTGRETEAATYNIKDPQFTIPLRLDVLSNFTYVDRGDIGLDSLNFIVYSLNVTETKWYQKTIFSVVLQIVSLILAAPTGGASVGWVAAIRAVVVAILISTALTMLGEAVGGTLGAIVAAVAAVYAAAYGIPGLGVSALPTAEAMLAGVNQLSTGFNAIAVNGLKALEEDMEDFTKSLEERTAALEAAEEGLNDESNDYLFNPLFIERHTPYFNANEAPEDFYRRSLETNPGVLTLDSIGGWATTALELPKASMYGLIRAHNKPISGANYDF